MKKAFLKALKAAGINFIRALWCDNANIIRGKSISVDHMSSQNLDHIAGISLAQQSVPLMYDAVIPGSGLFPVGEAFLSPDWDTFNLLPYTPTHASVISDLVHKNSPWEYCPRHFLKRMIKELKHLGYDINASFENEFYILKDTINGHKFYDDTLFASTYSMDINAGLMDKISYALQAQGMNIERYYSESGPGQQELTTGYKDPLSAADDQIIYRETVRAVCLMNGFTASFMPKPFEEYSGSGCHIHISLLKNGNLLSPVSPPASSFIGGILHHLPALMAVSAPTTNSYRRIKPHCWAGAFRCWGIDNREAPIRLLSLPEGPIADHFELKTVDASSNPFLVLGAIIACGIDGIRRGLKLMGPMESDPGHLTSAEREMLNIDRLPHSLAESLKHLSTDEVILNSLGNNLSKSYLAVKFAELEAMNGMTIEEERKVLLNKF